LQFILRTEHEELALRVLKRIDRPLRHLCMEAGIPEAYERFRFRAFDRPSTAASFAKVGIAHEVDTALQLNPSTPAT
jgi:hypothetical protein